MSVLPLVDRLSERGVIDRWGFLTFAAGGAVGIWLSKFVGAPPLATALFAGLAMAIYALLVQVVGTGRLRSDQAGDNCYYLGLIYTLTSLSYAIFTFDPADTATTIVQGFGIALVTTILGLVLRVFFSQSRVDLIDTEDSARLELADAAGRLRSEIGQIAVSFSDFGHQSIQILGELREAVEAAIARSQDAASDGIREIAESASNAISAQMTLTTNDIKRLSTATSRTITNLEKHASRLGDLVDSTDTIVESVSALERGTAATERAVLLLSEPLDRITSAQGEMLTLTSGVSNAVRTASDNVVVFGGHVADLNKSFLKRLDDVRAAPSKVVSDAETAIEAFVFKFTEELRELARVHGVAAEGIAAAAEAEVGAVRNHNAALEAELTRSREIVSKVHGAFVDMTGRLVDQVQNARP